MKRERGKGERGEHCFPFLSFFLSFPFPLPPQSHPTPLTHPPLPPHHPPLIFASSDMRGNLQQVEGVSAGEEGVPWVAAPTAFPKIWGTSPCLRGSPQEEARPPLGRRVGAPRGPEAAPRRPRTHVGPAPGSTSACGAGARREKPRGAVEGGTATHRRPRPTFRTLRGGLGGTPQGGAGRGSADRGGGGSGWDDGS